MNTTLRRAPSGPVVSIPGGIILPSITTNNLNAQDVPAETPVSSEDFPVYESSIVNLDALRFVITVDWRVYVEQLAGPAAVPLFFLKFKRSTEANFNVRQSHLAARIAGGIVSLVFTGSRGDTALQGDPVEVRVFATNPGTESYSVSSVGSVTLGLQQVAP